MSFIQSDSDLLVVLLDEFPGVNSGPLVKSKDRLIIQNYFTTDNHELLIIQDGQAIDHRVIETHLERNKVPDWLAQHSLEDMQ